MSALIKILLILAIIVLLVVPYVVNYWLFCCDCKKGKGYRRLLMFPFTVLLCTVVTIVLALASSVSSELGQLGFVQWIANAVFGNTATNFTANFIATLLINAVVLIGYVFIERIALLFINRCRKKKKTDLSEELPKTVDTEKSWTMKLIGKAQEKRWGDLYEVLHEVARIFSAVYLVFYVLCLFALAYGFGSWVNSAFIGSFHYPVIVMILLWEACWTTKGLQVEDEPLTVEKSRDKKEEDVLNELEDVAKELRTQYADHYARTEEFKLTLPQMTDLKKDKYDKLTRAIGGMELDEQKQVKQVCMDAIRILVKEEQSLILNGSFYSAFASCFFRYLNIVLARGNTVVFVCKDESEMRAVSRFVSDGFARLLSITEEDNVINSQEDELYNPVWNVCCISGFDEAQDNGMLNEKNILVTTPAFLCSNELKDRYESFIRRTDMIVMPCAVGIFSAYATQLNAVFERFDTLHCRKSIGDIDTTDKVDLVASDVRYVCFNEYGLADFDKRVKNILGSNFASLDLKLVDNDLIIDCFHLEGGDADRHKQLYESKQAIGMPINMALISAQKRTPNVSVFLSERLPYANWMESITSGIGNLSDGIDHHSLHVHGLSRKGVDGQESAYLFRQDYRHVIAYDEVNNLPLTVKGYADMLEDKKALLTIVSRPYLLRDYFIANLKDLYEKDQSFGIPFRSSEKEAASFRLLLKAEEGGVSEAEIKAVYRTDETLRRTVNRKYALRSNVHLLAKLKSVPVKEEQVYAEFQKIEELPPDRQEEEIRANKILCDYLINHLSDADDVFVDVSYVMLAALEICGFANEYDDFYRYFTHVSHCDYDENGMFKGITQTIVMRDNREFCDSMEGKDFIKIRIGRDEALHVLPILKERLYQNFIKGQNFVFRGNVVRIEEIDDRNGVIRVSYAEDGNNLFPYEYVQDREYYLDISKGTDTVEKGTFRLDFKALDSVVDSVEYRHFAAPAQVYTKGYFELDPLTGKMSSHRRYHPLESDESKRRVYRRYNSTQSVNDIGEAPLEMTPFCKEGMDTLSVKIKGNFGENRDKITLLLTTMINECLPTVYPYTYDCVVALPVLKDKSLWESEDAVRLGCVQPHVTWMNTDEQPNDDCIQFLIVEDCFKDIGVVEAILQQSHPLEKLFALIADYLTWKKDFIPDETNAVRADHLRYGKDSDLDCFDEEGLLAVAKALSGHKNFDYTRIQVEEKDERQKCCFCCDKRLTPADIYMGNKDSRIICKECARNLVGNKKKAHERYKKEAQRFFGRYGFDMDDYDIVFEPTVKLEAVYNDPSFVGEKGGTDTPVRSYIEENGRKAHVEYDIPGVNMCEELVRLFTRMWQLNRIEDRDAALLHGQVTYVGIQYLESLGNKVAKRIADDRRKTCLSSEEPFGVGYRELLVALEQPVYQHNVFRLVAEKYGLDVKFRAPLKIMPAYGKGFVPGDGDQKLTGEVDRLYYQHLDESLRPCYDRIVEAVKQKLPTIVFDTELTRDQLQVLFTAIESDNPDLFYLKPWTFTTGSAPQTITLNYYFPVDEIDGKIAEVEAGMEKFREGVTAEMSDYDKALRVHSNIVKLLHYDDVGLKRERYSSDDDQLDTLRTIYGPAIKSTGVCAAYAKVFQYILNREGIFCSYVTGRTERSGHAWNIINLYGEYYQVDVTWDDQSKTSDPSNDRVYMHYFCVTKQEILRSRDFSLTPFEVPNCTATRFNYYYRNDLVMKDKFDIKFLCRLARDAAEKELGYIEFKCETRELFDEAYEKFSQTDEYFKVREEYNKVVKADKAKKASRISLDRCNDTLNMTIFF